MRAQLATSPRRTFRRQQASNTESGTQRRRDAEKRRCIRRILCVSASLRSIQSSIARGCNCIAIAALGGLLLGAGAPAANAQEAAETPYTELLLTPRAVEQPLMKYRLMPAEFELKDGNAAPILLRLPWEQFAYFQKIVPTFSDYLELPLDDPKVGEAQDVLTSRIYEELKRAAYRRSAEWEYPIGEQPPIGIFLPDAQSSRGIVGRGLAVRIRSQIARGEHDEAVEGIKVGLALSRHYARTPFLVVQLISAALDLFMLDRVEELINTNGPNLYWALTALPRPLINATPSFELEQQILEMSIPSLGKLDELAGERAWIDAEDHLFDAFPLLTPGDYRLTGDARRDVRERLLGLARDELPSLLGLDAAQVAAMNDAEARLRWFMTRHTRNAQAVTAAVSLEPPLAIRALEKVEQDQRTLADSTGLPLPFGIDSLRHVYLAILRPQRRVDVLRVIEAIRNYAAANNGVLPPSLDAITETPIPNDLLTGKSFTYRLDGAVATLESDAPIKGHEIRYRLSIRK